MAKSKFQMVFLKYSDVETLMDNNDCESLVFQQDNLDDENSKKQFGLVCYGIKINGEAINSIPIVLHKHSSNYKIDGPKKILFGNMPIKKDRLKELFTNANLNLDFTPTQSVKFPKYVVYVINNGENDPEIGSLATEELNPSPPA